MKKKTHSAIVIFILNRKHSCLPTLIQIKVEGNKAKILCFFLMHLLNQSFQCSCYGFKNTYKNRNHYVLVFFKKHK